MRALPPGREPIAPCDPQPAIQLHAQFHDPDEFGLEDPFAMDSWTMEHTSTPEEGAARKALRKRKALAAAHASRTAERDGFARDSETAKKFAARTAARTK